MLWVAKFITREGRGSYIIGPVGVRKVHTKRSSVSSLHLQVLCLGGTNERRSITFFATIWILIEALTHALLAPHDITPPPYSRD